MWRVCTKARMTMAMIDDDVALQVFNGATPRGFHHLRIERAATPTDAASYRVGVAAVGAHYVDKFKTPPTVAPEDEFGTSGLNRFQHNMYEEWHRELVGRRGMSRYREMWDNNVIVDTAVRMLMLLTTMTKWEVKPAIEGNKQAELWAENMRINLKKMKQSWSAFILDAMTAVVYGFTYSEVMFHEIGPGLVGWKKIVSRSQESLDGWLYDEDKKEMVGMYQRPVYGPVTFVPIWKAMHFVPFAFRENPEGRSMLRSSYLSYKELKELTRYEGTGFERNVAGLPIATAPYSFFMESATPQEKGFLSNLAKLVFNLRTDSRSGLVFPAGVLPNGEPSGVGLSFANIQGAAAATPLGAAIVRRETRIAMALHSEQIMLGQDAKTGSHAMHSDKTTMQGRVAYALLDRLEDCINDGPVRQWMVFNDQLDEEFYPRLVHQDVEDAPITETLVALKGMFDLGMDVGDEEVRRRLLTRLNMPTDTTGEV